MTGRMTKWTEEHTRKMMRLLEQHKTKREVSKIMNIPESTISHRIYMLRKEGLLVETNSLKTQNALAAKWSDGEIEQLKEMYVHGGISTPRIALLLGKSASAVQGKVARMNLKREVKCVSIPVAEQARKKQDSNCDGCVKSSFCYSKWGKDAFLAGCRG